MKIQNYPANFKNCSDMYISNFIYNNHFVANFDSLKCHRACFISTSLCNAVSIDWNKF